MRDVKVEDILADAGVNDQYAGYVLGSQFAHGGMMGTELYRYEVCGDNTLIEDIRPNLWYVPFYICWYSIGLAWDKFLAKTGGNRSVFPASGIENKIHDALERLRTAPLPSA